uniref:Uncharacterized protein n=1 Tax=Arundo donax TaxID=35708 RepID=A0A0A9HF79_ARUDO
MIMQYVRKGPPTPARPLSLWRSPSLEQYVISISSKRREDDTPLITHLFRVATRWFDLIDLCLLLSNLRFVSFVIQS